MSDYNKNSLQAFDKETLYAIMEETEKLVGVGGWEWDITKDIWTFSDNWLRLHGCSDRHIKTADLILLAHPDDRADIQLSYDRVVSTGANYEIEHRIIRQDTGEERYIRSFGKPRLDSDGKVVKLFGSAQDITRQKKVEDALIVERKRLSMLLEAFPGFIYLQAPDYSVPFANKYFLDHFGDPQNLPCYKVLWNRQTPCDPCHTFKVFDSKIPQVWEWSQAPDGKTYMIHDFPFIDVDGTELVLEIGIDITEVKQAKQQLTSLEKRNHALLDHSPVCHKIVDLDFNLQYMSKSGFKILKLDHKTEVYGKPYPFYFFPESFKKEMFENLKMVKKTGEIITSEDLANDIEGNEVWFESSIIPVFDDDGKVDYLTVVSSNTTQRKKHEQEKIRFEEQLRQSQKMEAIGTLAGGIAHDFNNMLGVIKGNVSYLTNRIKNDENLVESLIDVQEAVKQGESLTEQLITFAKGGAPIKKSIELNSLIKNTVKLLLRGSASTYSFNLAESLWDVEADEGQLNQALSNLIINANQAMPEGGTIKVGTKNKFLEKSVLVPLPPGPYVKIKVEDQGIGIPKKHLSKIFDPFFTTRHKGSGLGLATTFSIIKKHHGHIWVESTLGEGTAFTIYLPITKKTLSQQEDKREIAHKGHGKILIMDDQEALLKVARRILSEMGYNTTFAKDGCQAIEIYREAFQASEPFDLVILDLTVPGGMGGVKAIPELLKINPDVKVVVSSGYSNDPVMADYKSYGFCGVFPKPYSSDQMAELLNEIFGKNK